MIVGNTWTALIWASSRGHRETASLLLDRGADINLKNNDGETALMEASSSGHTEIVSLLLDRGADVNVKDNDGGTALVRAPNELRYSGLYSTAYRDRRHVKP